MDWRRTLRPLLRYRREAQILGLLWVVASGCALGANALVAKLLVVDGDRLAAVRSAFAPSKPPGDDEKDGAATGTFNI